MYISSFYSSETIVPATAATGRTNDMSKPRGTCISTSSKAIQWCNNTMRILQELQHSDILRPGLYFLQNSISLSHINFLLQFFYGLRLEAETDCHTQLKIRMMDEIVALLIFFYPWEITGTHWNVWNVLSYNKLWCRDDPTHSSSWSQIWRMVPSQG